MMQEQSDYRTKYLQLGRQFAEKYLRIPTQNPQAFETIERDFNNTLNAIDIAYKDQDYTFLTPIYQTIQALQDYFLQREEFAVGLKYAAIGIDAAEKAGAAKQIGYLMNLQGIMEGNQGDFANAAKSFERSLQQAQITDDELLEARITLSLGALYFFQSRLALAYSNFERSLVLARQRNQRDRILKVLPNLALIEIVRANYTAAHTYLAEAKILQAERAEDDFEGVDINLGIVLGREGFREQAQQLLVKRLHFACREGAIADTLICLNNLAEIARLHADTAMMQQYLEQADPYLDDVELAEYSGFTLCLWGVYRGLCGQEKDAHNYWELSWRTAEKQGNIHLQATICLEKGFIYSRNGAVTKARNAYEQAITLAEPCEMWEIVGRASFELGCLTDNTEKMVFLQRAKTIFNEASVFANEIEMRFDNNNSDL